VQTMAVNAVAPFVMCSRLKAVMVPPVFKDANAGTSTKSNRNNRAATSDSDRNAGGGSNPPSSASSSSSSQSESQWSRLDTVCSHVINVTALEGKFNVGKKSGGHPHTNMAKAALNMMTLTGARDYAREGILMNSVDTGQSVKTSSPLILFLFNHLDLF
jgi:NAD(P)-dependent dehydrogenase (short-subunit alcohol dehydrogenase family)